MIVPVEQWAFGDGEVRGVEIPDYKLANETTKHMVVLEEVFYWGQNDHQNVEGRYSVSRGDVALLWGKRYLCCSVGWKELSKTGYERWKKITVEHRQILLVTDELSDYLQ